jgi:hypothetical protein
MLPAVEAKSRLPASAVLDIIALASGETAVSARSRGLADALGRVLCGVDDLVDLLTDCRRGAASTLVLRVSEDLERQHKSFAADADLYDVVEAAATELIELLASDALGPAERSVGPDGIGTSEPQLQDVVDLGVPSAARDFARLVVAGWVGWNEDDERRPAIPSIVAPARADPATRAARMLLDQQRAGYREAVHHLFFPREFPNGIRYETHPALLFQRAIVADALVDAFDAGLSVPRSVLDAEAVTLLRAKHRDARGGWTYIPEVPELPPDADDLGAVLQVLSRVGGRALASTCDEAIRLALDGTEPSGGMQTWILEPRRRTAMGETMRAYLKVIGGGGVHPDVVANLLYGLLLYDPDRYCVPLRRGVSYLAETQEVSGAWRSKWYAGPYYGTFRAVSVLGALAPGGRALSRARDFVRETQLASGAWGEGAGSALATALALLAMQMPGMRPERAAVARSIMYLMEAQEEDGGWPASRFIVFATTDGTETYMSRTVTTAFCLKALLASRPLFDVIGDKTSG